LLLNIPIIKAKLPQMDTVDSILTLIAYSMSSIQRAIDAKIPQIDIEEELFDVDIDTYINHEYFIAS
jgi:hypothetical protein